MQLSANVIECIVKAALEEDLGREGDVTTRAMFPPGGNVSGRILTKRRLVLAGLPLAQAVFRRLDPELQFSAQRDEGAQLEAGERVATVCGAPRSVLEGERTALNFLMRMSGIATAARLAEDEIAGTGARILDTRKTAPGLRALDKYAVSVGGALNHRMGLYDAAMVKDTHLAAAGSIAVAVAQIRAHGVPPERITVEVRSLEQLREAIDAGAGRALLDNMAIASMRRSVELAAGRITLEASGGLRLGKLRAVAETGVDFLSVGWLTHSAPAADLSMELEAAS